MNRHIILPLGTPDRPRSPAPIEPMETAGVDPSFRGCFWQIASISLALFWGAVAGILIGGGWPW